MAAPHMGSLTSAVEGALCFRLMMKASVEHDATAPTSRAKTKSLESQCTQNGALKDHDTEPMGAVDEGEGSF